MTRIELQAAAVDAFKGSSYNVTPSDQRNLPARRGRVTSPMVWISLENANVPVTIHVTTLDPPSFTVCPTTSADVIDTADSDAIVTILRTAGPVSFVA